jgi:dGTPase
LYCSALRRLVGVTQVVAASEGSVFHNRLTHTIKVAQVARRTAENLSRLKARSGIDPDVVEAAALAHDLGHPPFGHVAEVELDRLVRDKGFEEGFEGNAQSFRIVTKLAMCEHRVPGLDLTRASLNATLKYPWFREGKKGDKHWRKFGAYKAEADDFAFARELGPAQDRQSVEAEIMDWADDITYAIHDVEDLFRAGLIKPEVFHNPDVRSRFLSWVQDRWEQIGPSLSDDWDETAGENLLKLFPLRTEYDGGRQQRRALRDWVSFHIGQKIQATALAPAGGDSSLLIPVDQRRDVNLLKELVWYYVIERPSLATQQIGQCRIIREVFNVFWASAFDEDFHIGRAALPLRYREEIEDLETDDQYLRMRVVVDSVAGLAEDELVRIYSRISGTSLGSVLDPIR